MKIVRFSLATVFATLSLIAQGAPGGAKNQSAVQPATARHADVLLAARSLAHSSNAFAADIWRRLAKTPGNLAISPASITSALTMLCGGAEGETDRQIRKILHIEGDARSAGDQWGQLIARMQDPSRPLTLRVANRLFGEQTFVFEQPYLEWTNSAFGAALEPVSFLTDAQASRNHINAWVAGRTEQRIRDLLPAGSLDANTRLVLINAVYFHASWGMPFYSRDTSPAPFFVSPKRTIDVSMMSNTDIYHVVKTPSLTILELPYDPDSSMLIVLPDKTDGLDGVERTISAAIIEHWMSVLDDKGHSAFVSLPRFKIDPSTSVLLGDELKALGMPLAFASSADFSGIANPAKSGNRLVLANVFHKAFINVDERGTEAAAASGLETILVSGKPMPALDFKVDHPFFFLIVDKPSRLVLFMGRVSEPLPADGGTR